MRDFSRMLGPLREEVLNYAAGPMLETVIQYCKGPRSEEKAKMKSQLGDFFESIFRELEIRSLPHSVKLTIQLLTLSTCPGKGLLHRFFEKYLDTTLEYGLLSTAFHHLEVLDFLRKNLVCELKDCSMGQSAHTIRHMYIEYWIVCGPCLCAVASCVRPDSLLRNLDYLVELIVDRGAVEFCLLFFVLFLVLLLLIFHPK